MSQISVLDTLTNLFNHKPHIQKNGEELAFYCPKCNHYKKKLTININKEFFHCWICEFRGKSFYPLLKALNAPGEFYKILCNGNKRYKYKSGNKDEPQQLLSLPDNFRPLYKSSKNFVYKKCLKYCINRGLSIYEIIRYNIGYCDSGDFRGRVIIPSYDLNNKLNFYCGRDVFNGKMKYKLCSSSKNIIGFESFINFNHSINLVEGVFDAFSVRNNVIPLFGKTLSNNLKLKLILKKPPRVNVLLDNDALEHSMKICQFLLQNKIKTHLIFLDEKDPNEMGFKKINEYINESTQITESDLFKFKVTHNL